MAMTAFATKTQRTRKAAKIVPAAPTFLDVCNITFSEIHNTESDEGYQLKTVNIYVARRRVGNITKFNGQFEEWEIRTFVAPAWLSGLHLKTFRTITMAKNTIVNKAQRTADSLMRTVYEQIRGTMNHS